MNRVRAPQKDRPPARPRKGAERKGTGAPHKPEGESPAAAVRLQKFMARAGIGSRRQCEELITSGRVEIDGKTVVELGTKVQPHARVTVDGTALAGTRLAYYIVNKPQGVVSTNFDPSGRPRVIDLLPNVRERLFTVGRLDMSSEGLILLTNDGELANRLAHPRYEVEKTYHVLVAGTPDLEVLATLRRGVHLAEGMARVTGARIKKTLKQSTLLEIVLSEGKNREIRRVLAKVGHKVLRLKRIAIGNVRLGELAAGESRRLTSDEVKGLRDHRRNRSARANKLPGKSAAKPTGTSIDKVSVQSRPRPAAAGPVEQKPPVAKDRSRDVERPLPQSVRQGAVIGETPVAKLPIGKITLGRTPADRAPADRAPAERGSTGRARTDRGRNDRGRPEKVKSHGGAILAAGKRPPRGGASASGGKKPHREGRGGGKPAGTLVRHKRKGRRG
jgi:23S rRNA pseudouridine2605 synthase